MPDFHKNCEYLCTVICIYSENHALVEKICGKLRKGEGKNYHYVVYDMEVGEGEIMPRGEFSSSTFYVLRFTL